MIWGVVIILAFSALLALIVYLYQEHVDYLNRSIRELKSNIETLQGDVDTYKELLEDTEGYYEKWLETVADLDEANQKVWDLEEEIKHLENQIQFLQEYKSEYM